LLFCTVAVVEITGTSETLAPAIGIELDDSENYFISLFKMRYANLLKNEGKLVFLAAKQLFYLSFLFANDA